MKVNLNQKLICFDGVKIINNKEENITLKNLIVNSLMAQEEGIDGSEKMRRYNLAEKIFKADEYEFEPDTFKYLDGIIEKLESTRVYGLFNNIFIEKQK